MDMHVAVASSAIAAQEDENGASRRKSGRVSKKPELLVDQLAVSAKRKRTADGVEADSDAESGAADEGDDIDMDDEDEESDEDDGDDEGNARRKRAAGAKKAGRKVSGVGAKPRAAKKPKHDANGNEQVIPIRSSKGSAKSRSKKAVRFSTAADAGGLFAELFATGKSPDTVATEWISRISTDQHEALAELFTFLLRCAGCEEKVEGQMLEDPDTYPDQLSHIQDSYQAKNVTDYPLISRTKGSSAFKQTFTAFISSIVLSLTKSGLFFQNEPLIENIRSWVSTMSSATNRPLRHTATVAALAFQSGLAEYGRELVETSAIQLRQTQAEKKRGKTVNRARLIEMENQVKVNARNQEVVRTELNDWFDAVFIHRYRDVDHHIRLECMQALGDFVMIYPELFFEGQYTRYFGWLMSDINAQTRMETIKSLMRIYRDHDKLSGMRAFTERFRERMVEMATRDSDPAVRAAVIEMLDTIRGAGFLEPTDIDLLGRLIFDSEVRVRKAVVKFFIDNVNDSYDSRLEDLGGKEATDELFKNHDKVNENYDTPRVEWLRLKVLIETLTAYDAEDELAHDGMIQVPESNSYMIVPGLQSRFALAAEELCEKIPDLQWEILAGFVLYDHSGTATQNGSSRSRNSSAQLLGRFKAEVKLSEKEEVLLLEVLNSAVKLSLRQSQELLNDKSRKLTKAQRLVEQEEFDGKARHLTNLIPRLLNKFGALPEAASAILRLEHVLSPENQDASAYSSLLNDIKKQFQTHVKPRVLEEASLALLNARSGEAEEVAQNHLHNLAEDSSRKLSILAKGQDLSVRGDLDDDTLDILEGAAIRLEMLGRIEDICDLLETPPSEPRKRVSTLPAPVDILLMILNRGLVDDTSEPGGREDEIVLHAARALGFYFMWKVRALQNQIRASGAVSPTTITSLSSRKEDFIATVTSVLQQRNGADDLRVFLAGALVDLHVGFASLVRVKPPTKRSAEDGTAGHEDRAYLALVTEIPKSTQTAFLQILAACERAFAKRTKRSLERNPEEQKPQDDNAEPATDDEPEEDDEPEDDQDDDMDLDDPNASPDAKLAATLFAEQRLCEFAGKLVLGIWADVVDGKSEIGATKLVRRRLKRNRTRLGPNFKGIVDALEKGAGGASKGGAAKKGDKAPVKSAIAGGTSTAVKAAASGSGGNVNQARHANEVIVVESEEEEEDDDEEMEEAD